VIHQGTATVAGGLKQWKGEKPITWRGRPASGHNALFMCGHQNLRILGYLATAIMFYVLRCIFVRKMDTGAPRSLGRNDTDASRERGSEKGVGEEKTKKKKRLYADVEKKVC